MDMNQGNELSSIFLNTCLLESFIQSLLNVNTNNLWIKIMNVSGSLFSYLRKLYKQKYNFRKEKSLIFCKEVFYLSLNWHYILKNILIFLSSAFRWFTTFI